MSGIGWNSTREIPEGISLTTQSFGTFRIRGPNALISRPPQLWRDRSDIFDIARVRSRRKNKRFEPFGRAPGAPFCEKREVFFYVFGPPLRGFAPPLRPENIGKKTFLFSQKGAGKRWRFAPKVFPFFDFFWLSGTIVNIKKRVFERKLPLFTPFSGPHFTFGHDR